VSSAENLRDVRLGHYAWKKAVSRKGLGASIVPPGRLTLETVYIGRFANLLPYIVTSILINLDSYTNT